MRHRIGLAVFTLVILGINSANAEEKVSKDKRTKKSTVEVVAGKAAPDFTVTGLDGEKFKLSEKLKSQDKNIVLLFSRGHW